MSITVGIAKAFIARAEGMQMKPGLKRDRAALEFVIGAAAALRALPKFDRPKDAANVNAMLTRVEWMALMTSTNGYAWLQEAAASKGD